jgi:hypothetical protein
MTAKLFLIILFTVAHQDECICRSVIAVFEKVGLSANTVGAQYNVAKPTVRACFRNTR